MHSKGQVTVFVIVGLLIVAVFAGTFMILSYAQRSSLKEEVKAPWTIPGSSSVPVLKHFCWLLAISNFSYFGLPCQPE